MNKEIKYIGYYDVPASEIKRNNSLSASNKMDYIINSLNKVGYNVNIISTAYSIEKNYSFYKKSVVKHNTNNKITFFYSLGSKNILMERINILLSMTQLFFYLLFNTKKNEKIIVYHAPLFYIPIRLAKKIKKFHVILEFEEIYADIFNDIRKIYIKWEKQLIEISDSYILVSETLKNIVSKDKPTIVLYGSYKKQPILSNPADDGKIHLVYSGTVDSITMSAFNAIEAARYLSSDYILHIIGPGEINLLKNKIDLIQKETNCQIVYDGIKLGEDYIRYIQSCHFGLNTRTMKGKFLSTSFPSKVLSYLSLGINVISSDIDNIRTSPVGDIITFYENDTPQAIAETINSAIKFDREVLQSRIIQMDKKFTSELKSLLENIDLTN